MKVYTPYIEHARFLKEHLPESISLTDEKTDADVFVTGKFTADEYHERLKAIVIPFTAHNNIDLQTVRRHSLKLFNTAVHAPYVAERAMQLTLSLMGRMVEFHRRLAAGDWIHRNSLKRLHWTSLYKKRVGLYGYGRIGKAYRKLLAPFDVEIVVIDRGKDYEGAKTVSSLEKLIEASDVILIAAPLTEETKGAFDDEALSRMHDKFLINVARGKIVEEEALYKALRNKTLGGYASDVWYRYPKEDERITPSNYPIEEFDNVVLSPHCGSFTPESRRSMQEHVLNILENIERGDTSAALNLETLR